MFIACVFLMVIGLLMLVTWAFYSLFEKCKSDTMAFFGVCFWNLGLIINVLRQ